MPSPITASWQGVQPCACFEAPVVETPPVIQPPPCYLCSPGLRWCCDIFTLKWRLISILRSVKQFLSLKLIHYYLNFKQQTNHSSVFLKSILWSTVCETPRRKHSVVSSVQRPCCCASEAVNHSCPLLSGKYSPAQLSGPAWTATEQKSAWLPGQPELSGSVEKSGLQRTRGGQFSYPLSDLRVPYLSADCLGRILATSSQPTS